jgi:hypothetical protein
MSSSDANSSDSEGLLELEAQLADAQLKVGE